LAKQGGFAAPIRNFCRLFFFSPALRLSAISGLKIAAPLVLAQHKGHKRIGKAPAPIRRALPIDKELTYYFCCTDQNWQYVQYEITSNYKI
jgi:hypothetical protein